MTKSKLLKLITKCNVNKEKAAIGAGICIFMAYGIRRYCHCILSYIKYQRSVVQMLKHNENGKAYLSSQSLISSQSNFIDHENVRIDNRHFCKQLHQLIKIMIPSLWSKECGTLVFHSSTLIIRTFVSVYVAKLDGRIVKTIVQRDVNTFFMQLFKWLMVAVPATFINSLIRYIWNINYHSYSKRS